MIRLYKNRSRKVTTSPPVVRLSVRLSVTLCIVALRVGVLTVFDTQAAFDGSLCGGSGCNAVISHMEISNSIFFGEVCKQSNVYIVGIMFD